MKLFYLILILVSVIGCRKPEKNFEDYFPELKVTAVAQNNGTVIVTGTIVKEGAIAYELIGFSFGESPDTPINENQIIVSQINGNTFTATFPPLFDMTKTYYFKAWVTNNLGYKTSEVVSLSNIIADPVDGPCTYTMDYLVANAVVETVGTPSSWQENTDFDQFFTASGSYTNMTFTFDNIPSTGGYTTTQGNPGPGEVKVAFTNTLSVFINTSLLPGDSVYVNRPTANSWTFEICSGKYVYNSFTYNFVTYFDK
ncbi:MAG: hypothetical protein COA33_012020 [Fluviicola sp.]|nr:hypothetical protein [Fluviicola sp.]